MVQLYIFNLVFLFYLGGTVISINIWSVQTCIFISVFLFILVELLVALIFDLSNRTFFLSFPFYIGGTITCIHIWSIQSLYNLCTTVHFYFGFPALRERLLSVCCDHKLALGQSNLLTSVQQYWSTSILQYQPHQHYQH